MRCLFSSYAACAACVFSRFRARVILWPYARKLAIISAVGRGNRALYNAYLNSVIAANAADPANIANVANAAAKALPTHRLHRQEEDKGGGTKQLK